MTIPKEIMKKGKGLKKARVKRRGTKIKKINEEEVGGLGGFKEREKCESYWVRW